MRPQNLSVGSSTPQNNNCQKEQQKWLVGQTSSNIYFSWGSTTPHRGTMLQPRWCWSFIPGKTRRGRSSTRSFCSSVAFGRRLRERFCEVGRPEREDLVLCTVGRCFEVWWLSSAWSGHPALSEIVGAPPAQPPQPSGSSKAQYTAESSASFLNTGATQAVGSYRWATYRTVECLVGTVIYCLLKI